MNKFEEYRKNAEEARRQADRAETDEVRAAWLQLARAGHPSCRSETYREDKSSTLRSKRNDFGVRKRLALTPTASFPLFYGCFRR